MKDRKHKKSGSFGASSSRSGWQRSGSRYEVAESDEDRPRHCVARSTKECDARNTLDVIAPWEFSI